MKLLVIDTIYNINLANVTNWYFSFDGRGLYFKSKEIECTLLRFGFMSTLSEDILNVIFTDRNKHELNQDILKEMCIILSKHTHALMLTPEAAIMSIAFNDSLINLMKVSISNDRGCNSYTYSIDSRGKLVLSCKPAQNNLK